MSTMCEKCQQIYSNEQDKDFREFLKCINVDLYHQYRSSSECPDCFAQKHLTHLFQEECLYVRNN